MADYSVHLAPQLSESYISWWSAQ